MTRHAPLWLQSGSYAGSDDRGLPGALWPAAASSGCAVSASSGMALNIAPGYVAVPTPNNTGTTLCRSDAVEVVTLDPAPAAGTNRIDLVVCHARGTDLDGGVNNDFVFEKVTGTGAASPVAPATPAGAVALANVYVGGGVAAIVAGNITDVRPTTGLAVPSLWSLPRGLEGRLAQSVANQTSANSTTVDLPGLTITWTPVAGRQYVAVLSGAGSANTTPSNVTWMISDGANTQLGGSFSSAPTGTPITWPVYVRTPLLTPPAGVPYTVKGRMLGTSADSRWTPAAGRPGIITVEDVGGT